MTELHPTPKKPKIHVRIVIGLIIGIVLGLAANEWSLHDPQAKDIVQIAATNLAEPVGQIFLRMITMVVVPLVISALILGIYEIGDVRKLGRLGLRTLLLTAILSTSAVAIGVTIVNVFKPGHFLSQGNRDKLVKQFAVDAGKNVEKAKQAKSVKEIIVDIIPQNPLQEMVGAVDGSSKGNGMLAVMFFALMIGIALTVIEPARSAPLVRVLEGVFDACMAIIGFAMWLAPVAVACLVFVIASKLGLEIVQSMFGFVLTGVLGLAIQLFVVYPLCIWQIGKMRPGKFFSGAKEAIYTAFGTSSSNATLPTSLRVTEENLGVPRDISRFVLTVGATGNQNGTALYEGVVVLFLAQVFGVDLTVWQQVTVVHMSVLAGIGTAGVPGGSIPMIVVVLQAVNVPSDGIAIILGLDRLLDMCRTVVNVAGDIVIAVCVAKGEEHRTSETIARNEA